MIRRPCSQCGRGRAERFYRSARARVCLDCQKRTRRATSRAGHIARTYDLDAATYAALLAHQQGVCAICGQERRYQLNVDHDHATGAVRGLLCRRCNKVLAAVRDDGAVLATAAAYLTMPPMVTLKEPA